ncbi:MAG: hypothetical protein BECKG1743F_GA0114225_112841 [Candidatus Kentron sp. G]|nr:MAG: hypothetical protein BECKG1743F_GA0114225_112841 [Candidatus Kentron sp. G]
MLIYFHGNSAFSLPDFMTYRAQGNRMIIFEGNRL